MSAIKVGLIKQNNSRVGRVRHTGGSASPRTRADFRKGSAQTARSLQKASALYTEPNNQNYSEVLSEYYLNHPGPGPRQFNAGKILLFFYLCPAPLAQSNHSPH